MPLSSKQRAFIALGIFGAIVAAGAGIYVHSRRTASPAEDAEPPLDIFAEPSKPTAAASNILSELPPDAPAFAYIDVAELRKLQGSPLASLLGLVDTKPKEDSDYRRFVRGTAFDYSRDLDRLAGAFWLAGEGYASANAGARTLVFADGRFDVKKIEEYALKSGHAISRENQSIFEIPGNPPAAFRFLSPTRIELGSGKNPVQLLRALDSQKSDPSLQGRLETIGGAPIFAVARTDKLPASFYENFNKSAQVESLVRSLRVLALAGQPGGDVLRVALDGETTSSANALEIATLLDISRMGASFALADPKTRAQMTGQQSAFLDALIRQLKITHQGRWVRLRIDITPQMLGDTSAPAHPPSDKRP